MSWFLLWYLIVTALGWMAFPVVFRLFPALPERGYAFARITGLLIWGYLFWLFTSLDLAQNDVGGLLSGLLVLAGLSAWAFNSQKEELAAWIKRNTGLIRTVEVLFLLAFAFLALMRASNPELTSAEKPMELMFINAILRSPEFPPRDAWLSGYAISYYYFGYVMAAMLARLSGAPGPVAHNLMTALVFGLGSLGAYGILYNLLSWRKDEDHDLATKVNLKAALLGPLFLLLVSNLEGFLEVVHRAGLFWTENTSRFWLWLKEVDRGGLIWRPDTTVYNFWTWLDIRDLNLPPAEPHGWLPSRYLWWWRASRVVQDYDLTGTFREIIDEFPFFSFLHADLHPHVLAIPFGLLSIAIALHIYLGGWKGRTDFFGLPVYISRQGFLFTSLTLGGLAFLNTWDILVAAVLILGAYLLAREADAGWGWARLEETSLFGLLVAITAFVLYLPFYLGFSSQLGGVLPNLVYPTRGAHLWVMFGTLWLPLCAYLLYLWRDGRARAKWRSALALSLGLVTSLWAFSWLLGWAISLTRPEEAMLFLNAQGVSRMSSLFVEVGAKRLLSIGGLLSVLGVLLPALALLLGRVRLHARDGEAASAPEPVGFVLLMIALAAVLVIGPEFLYLRDQFGTRINTIFKFYYQAWMLWSLAAAYGVVVLLRSVRGIQFGLSALGIAALLLVGLTYPVLGIHTHTDTFRLGRAWSLAQDSLHDQDELARADLRRELASLWTLDYFEYVQRQSPDEAAALRWLLAAPGGVVAEAIGGSYSGYARVSTYTGLPTVLGWPGHESQWRGGYEEQGTRQADIQTLYATVEWEVASEIIERYGIRYVYVGRLERMEPLQEAKFARYLHLAFQQGEVSIYEVP